MPLNLRSRASRLFGYDGEDIRQLTRQPYENLAQFIGSSIPMYTELASFVITLALLVGLVFEDVGEFIRTFSLGDLPVLSAVPGWSEVPFIPTFITMGLVVFAVAFAFGEAMSSPEEDLVDNARRGVWYLFAGLAIYGAIGIDDTVLTTAVSTAGFFLVIAFLSLAREAT